MFALFAFALVIGSDAVVDRTRPKVTDTLEGVANPKKIMRRVERTTLTHSLTHSLTRSLTQSTIQTQGPEHLDQVEDLVVQPHEKGKTVEASLYLDQVRDTITGSTLRTPSVPPYDGSASSAKLIPFDELTRWQGTTWCTDCYSMAGGARIQNVRELVETTIANHVPGDFLEAGSWRGGSSIMARVVQNVMGEGDKRNIYVCDSFDGIPRASTKTDSDNWNAQDFLKVSQEEVEDNFKRFHALDKNVKFRKGYFSNSLPKLKDELSKEGRTLAVLRGDGDMYESYMDILYNMYDFLEVGGYFICDDCPMIGEAKKAIDDFRKDNGISAPIQKVSGSPFGTYWKKESHTPIDYSRYLKWNTTRVFKK